MKSTPIFSESSIASILVEHVDTLRAYITIRARKKVICVDEKHTDLFVDCLHHSCGTRGYSEGLITIEARKKGKLRI